MPPEWKNLTLQSFREKVTHHGGKVNFVEQVCTLRINEKYGYKPEITRVLEHLRQHVHIDQIASKFMKYIEL